MPNRLAAPTQLLPYIGVQYMKSFIVQAGKSSIGSEQIEDLSILNNATKKEQGDKGMVFSSSKRDFDFLNSCLYLSIGDVLCGY